MPHTSNQKHHVNVTSATVFCFRTIQRT